MRLSGPWGRQMGTKRGDGIAERRGLVSSEQRKGTERGGEVESQGRSPLASLPFATFSCCQCRDKCAPSY